MHQPTCPSARRPRSRRLGRTLLVGLIAAAATPVATAGAADLTEGFDAFPPSGWMTQNNSAPVGSISWFQGTATTATPTPGPFNSYNGAANSYVGVNFNSTGSTGTISNWLITPPQTGLTQGDTVSFYTRRPTISGGQTEYPDRLELRVSTNGTCSPGTGVGSVGDFTTHLLSVNPTEVTGVYPDTWTRYEATLPPMAPATGCVAFRYYVTQAGSLGIKSDYIGIDQVELRDQADNIFPVTTISDGPSGATASDAPTFAYAATPAAGVGSYECRLTSGDDVPGSFTSCLSSGQSYADLDDGTYTFEARGVSHGGNVAPTAASRTFTVDTTAPDTTITAGPDGPTGSADATFTYAGVPADDTDGFECRLVPDGGTASFAPCPTTGPSYTELDDGTYTFEVRAHDALGNTDPTPASRTFTVDTTAPDTTISAGPSGTVGPGDVTFTYEGIPADDTDRFECRLRTADDDDPVFASCPDEGRTYSGLADGTYTFEVRAIDAVNNTDLTPASGTFTVEAPAVPPGEGTLPTGGTLPGEGTPPTGGTLPGEGTPPTDVGRTPGPTSELPLPAAPQISGLRLERTVFRAARSGPAFGPAKKSAVSGGRGAWLRFSVDRATRVELRISRSVKRRWKPLRGKVTRSAPQGANRIPVRGRFRDATLRPGVYRLSVTLVDRGSGAKTTTHRTFRIKR